MWKSLYERTARMVLKKEWSYEDLTLLGIEMPSNISMFKLVLLKE